MKDKKILILEIMALILIIFSIFIVINHITYKDKNNNEDSQKEIYKDAITKDCEIVGMISDDDNTTYMLELNNESNIEEVYISSKDYSLPSNLYDYKESIIFRITFSKDFKVYEIKIIDKLTNKEITDLSNDKIEKLYSIELGKETIKKDWVEEIKLSSLKEDVIYEYTASKKVTEEPKIINDTNENCIVYSKDNYDEKFDFEIVTSKKITAGISGSYNEFDVGQTYSIIYKKIDNKELLSKVDSDAVIYLSKYKSGDELDYSFGHDYIYNDTNKDIILIVDEQYQESYEITIGKNKIIGFSWMIDSITIK